MKEIFLIATGNDGFRYRYEFKKEKSFKKLFLDFMQELGFNKEKDLFYCEKTYEQDEEGKEVLVVRDITKSKNFSENYKNKEFDVDLIFFDETTEIVVRTKNNKKLVKAVNKFFKFSGE